SVRGANLVLSSKLMAKKLSVPQKNLESVRSIVDAAAAGASTRKALESVTGIADRAVGYAVAAAEALLLVREHDDSRIEPTELGRMLASTGHGSDEEIAVL